MGLTCHIIVSRSVSKERHQDSSQERTYRLYHSTKYGQQPMTDTRKQSREDILARSPNQARSAAYDRQKGLEKTYKLYYGTRLGQQPKTDNWNQTGQELLSISPIQARSATYDRHKGLERSYILCYRTRLGQKESLIKNRSGSPDCTKLTLYSATQARSATRDRHPAADRARHTSYITQQRLISNIWQTPAMGTNPTSYITEQGSVSIHGRHQGPDGDRTYALNHQTRLCQQPTTDITQHPGQDLPPILPDIWVRRRSSQHARSETDYDHQPIQDLHPISPNHRQSENYGRSQGADRARLTSYIIQQFLISKP